MSLVSSPVVSTGQRIFSANYGADLIVSACHWSAARADDSGTDAIVRGDVEVSGFTATADGRGYVAEWHQGSESVDAVYVERFEDGECLFHGWVDSVSRRIVQAG